MSGGNPLKKVASAVSTVFDPFDVGYGDKFAEAVTLGAVDLGKKKGGPQIEGRKPVAPTPDSKTSRRNREREYMRRYATAGRAGTALSRGSQLG